ncbi:MAG TPA: hypothetical protein VN688_24260 [Gemmataceae bacterium]|nr:hypothetical protein [Gemmataceae bacterium]
MSRTDPAILPPSQADDGQQPSGQRQSEDDGGQVAFTEVGKPLSHSRQKYVAPAAGSQGTRQEVDPHLHPEEKRYVDVVGELIAVDEQQQKRVRRLQGGGEEGGAAVEEFLADEIGEPGRARAEEGRGQAQGESVRAQGGEGHSNLPEGEDGLVQPHMALHPFGI